jgi:DNA repair protein RadA/Sms
MTEFQALCQKCYVGFPKRTVQGVEANRVSVLLAVIEKTLGQSFSGQEVYCKVSSGHRIIEPAADLAMLMALVSAVEFRPLPADLLFLGEVGLGGELRSFPAVQSRLLEAKAVGMKKVVVPKWLVKEAKEVKDLEIIPVQNVREAYKAAWNKNPEIKEKSKSQSDNPNVPAYRPAKQSEFTEEMNLDF